MQRLKLLGLALMAVFALGAVVSASASASSPIPLNASGVEPASVKFSGHSNAVTKFTILEGFGVTECPEVLFEGELNPLLGPFHLHWHNCTTPLGGDCTGLGDELGLILALGTAHLVFDSLSPELGAAILFLLEHVHYVCEGAFIGKKLILVLGEVLCLITPINTAAQKKFTVSCKKGAKAGDPAETMYWNGAGTLVEIPNGLLASEDEGTTYKMSAQEGQVEVETTEAVEIMA